MHFSHETNRLEETRKLWRVPLVVAAISLGGIFTFASRSPEQFYHSYLTAVLFWTGIGLGGVFITMLHHLTASVWSVALRRITEAIANTLPVMAILFIPILLGMTHLYTWSRPEVVAADANIRAKAGYLNVSFFTIRTIIYFAVWSLLAWRLGRASDIQDRGATPEDKRRFIKWSAPGMILFAITVGFASFDWMMSLQPHWYSTIYGVYFAMGSIMATLAILVLIVAFLKRAGALVGIITEEHDHDLAKLFFTFIILWAYMAFSQYFLIWYANIPEETIFFHDRWVGSWKAVSLLIVFGHFMLPFFLLISRPAKRNLTFLSIIAIWMLIMHWVDLFWNVEPSFHPANAHIAPSDLTTMVAVGSLFFWRFWTYLIRRPLIPIGDPKLQASIETVSR